MQLWKTVERSLLFALKGDVLDWLSSNVIFESSNGEFETEALLMSTW